MRISVDIFLETPSLANAACSAAVILLACISADPLLGTFSSDILRGSGFSAVLLGTPRSMNRDLLVVSVLSEAVLSPFRAANKFRVDIASRR